MTYTHIYKVDAILHEGAKGFLETYNQEFEMVDNIEKYAGSFVKKLGEAYRLADNSNKLKLLNAFPEYFSKYRDWGKK